VGGPDTAGPPQGAVGQVLAAAGGDHWHGPRDRAPPRADQA
jgi:hypothetical protein